MVQGELAFAELLRRVAAVPGIRRVRFTSPHPSFVGDDLIARLRRARALCPHLHLPVQSGSDAVLAAMNRRYDRKSYVETLARLRAARPGIALTTDLIVGFPTETDADFAETLSLMRRGPLHRQLLVQVLGAARNPGGAPRAARAGARAGPGAPRAAPGAPARAHARRPRRAGRPAGGGAGRRTGPSGRPPAQRPRCPQPARELPRRERARTGQLRRGRRRRLHAPLAPRRPGRPLRLKEDPLAAEKEYGLSCTRLGPRPLAARGETLPPKARILAIDDQLYFRSFVEGLLSEAGYAIRTAESESRGIEIAARDGRPDVADRGSDAARRRRRGRDRPAARALARRGAARAVREPRSGAARRGAPRRRAATSCPSPSTARRCCAPSPRWPRRRAPRTRSRASSSTRTCT